MPAKIVCSEGHRGGDCRGAAGHMAKTGALPSCQRSGCSAKTRYLFTQTYPGKGTSEYELVAVARLWDDRNAEDEGYDPMIFVLRDKNERLIVWPFYWTKNRHGGWHVGQFPPLFSIADFAAVLKQLPQEVRSTLRVNL